MNASDTSDKFSEENLLYDGACNVVNAEVDHLKDWRGLEPRVGLALSGGGIRSASYCLGVIQALAYRRALPNIDYMSTVSGGGYIGASLSYLLHQSASGAAAAGFRNPPKFDVSRENFPYVSYPMVGVAGAGTDVNAGPSAGSGDEQLRQNEKFKGRLLRRLRQSANYLVPGNGITFLSLAGVVLRNLAASLVVHVALLLALFQVFFLSGLFNFTTYPETTAITSAGSFVFPASNAFLGLAGWVIAAYGLLSLLYVVCTRTFDKLERQDHQLAYWVRRHYEVTVHYLFVVAIALLVTGGLPWLHEFLLRSNLTHITGWLDVLGKGDKGKPAATGMVAAVVGIIGNVWGLLQARSSKKHLIPTALVVGVASVMLFFGLLLLVYSLTSWLQLHEFAGGSMEVVVVAGLVLLVFGWLPEANYVSLHRFYRDRLLELFLPDLKVIHDNMMASSREERVAGSRPGDATLLGDLCRAPLCADSAQPGNPVNKRLRGPYHIINANIVLTASQHPRYRPRGGDNYIFSPLFCGSRATGWDPTVRTPGNGLTLATAMAISGAAVNPNAGPGGQGITRQPVLSVLMGLLNLRLGFWARNPKQTSKTTGSSNRIRWIKPNLLYPGLFESFGRFNLNENARYSLITDGGHFENLGLYELVRRRLKLIIVCDATADPTFKFADLANAIQKVRADFGALIDVNAEQLATLTPQSQDAAGKDGRAQATASRGYLIVPIRYSLRVGQDPNCGRDVGTLILLKATAFKGSPADLFSYRREHPEFPNQATLDQFFDEKQFDSYRELGYVTAYQMLRELEASGPEQGHEYQTTKGYMAPTNHQAACLLFGWHQHESSTQPVHYGQGVNCSVVRVVVVEP
jgi:hypothetical protein